MPVRLFHAVGRVAPLPRGRCHDPPGGCSPPSVSEVFGPSPRQRRSPEAHWVTCSRRRVNELLGALRRAPGSQVAHPDRGETSADPDGFFGAPTGKREDLCGSIEVAPFQCPVPKSFGRRRQGGGQTSSHEGFSTRACADHRSSERRFKRSQIWELLTSLCGAERCV